MSKPRGGRIGAWAEEAERADEEERQRLAAAVASSPQFSGGTVEPQIYPSLKEAAAVKPKKKNITMSLSEFTVGNYVGPGGGGGGGRHDVGMDSKGLTTDEMLGLPTGPKERSVEEMEIGRLGGGFKSYGARTGPPPGRMKGRDDDFGGSWGGGGRRSYGGFDDDRRAPPPARVFDYDQTSRADDVDNWAMGKKPLPSMNSGRSQNTSGRNGRYRFLGSPSRADEMDNWAIGKKPLPPRSTSFNSGFMDSTGPKKPLPSMDSGRSQNTSGRNDRYGFLGSPSRADEMEHWAIGKKSLPPRSTSFNSGFRDSTGPETDRWSGEGVSRNGDRFERQHIVPDLSTSERRSSEQLQLTRPSPFGAARPREDVLASKGLDSRKLDSEIEAKKISHPISAHNSRPTSSHSNRPKIPALLVVEKAVAKPQPKVNPFGDAKPRELLLQEKGIDWRKIDFELEHQGIDRLETDGEKILKEKINNLKKELENKTAVNGESLDEGSDAEQGSLHEMIHIAEKDLERLTCELDDKVRFGEKASGRPSPAAGKVIDYPHGSPSQYGMSHKSRDIDFKNIPQSRGSIDAWTRSIDNRGAFKSGRERRFPGNRYMGRGFPGNRDMGRGFMATETWTGPEMLKVDGEKMMVCIH